MGRKDHSHEADTVTSLAFDVWDQHIELPPGTEQVDIRVSAQCIVYVQLASGEKLYFFLLNKGKLKAKEPSEYSLIGGGCRLNDNCVEPLPGNHRAEKCSVAASMAKRTCEELLQKIDPRVDAMREIIEELTQEMTDLSELTGDQITTPNYPGNRTIDLTCCGVPRLRHRVFPTAPGSASLRLHFLYTLSAREELADYLMAHSHRIPNNGGKRRSQSQQLTHAFLQLSGEELHSIIAAGAQPDGSYLVPGLTYRGDSVHLSSLAGLVG